MASQSQDELAAHLFGARVGRGEQKKLQIVEAVVSILAHQGLAELTFEAVGDKVKIGKANVRYHFPTTQDLIVGAIRYITYTAQRLTEKAVAEAKTPAAQLEAIVEAAFEWFRKYPDHVPVWAVFCYYSSVNEELAAVHGRIRDEGRARLEGILKEMGVRHEAPSLAFHIQAAITGALLDIAVARKGKDSADIEKKLIRFLREICRK